MPEVWGAREALIDRAAREINETGEVCVDTFLQITRQGVTSAEVADRLIAIHAIEEEND